MTCRTKYDLTINKLKVWICGGVLKFNTIKNYIEKTVHFRCRQWVKIVGNEDLLHLPIEKLYELKPVCGEHFKKSNFNKRTNSFEELVRG